MLEGMGRGSGGIARFGGRRSGEQPASSYQPLALDESFEFYA